ncbi:hypothetical protein [Variovorax sp. YR752]|uniref:hypothetical protein n=1 Tax=Variovorax sp. YR752 TaxID=1884383 RepID=UPI0031378BCD
MNFRFFIGLSSYSPHSGTSPSVTIDIPSIMNSIPISFVIFKVLVLSVGMYLAVKWHYERGQKDKNQKTAAVVLTSIKVGGAFVASAFLVLFLTFEFCNWMGLDLAMQ